MPIKWGEENIVKIYKGNSSIIKIYQGDNLVYTGETEITCYVADGTDDGDVNQNDATVHDQEFLLTAKLRFGSSFTYAFAHINTSSIPTSATITYARLYFTAYHDYAGDLLDATNVRFIKIADTTIWENPTSTAPTEGQEEYCDINSTNFNLINKDGKTEFIFDVVKPTSGAAREWLLESYETKEEYYCAPRLVIKYT